jgi:hypothetical protein
MQTDKVALLEQVVERQAGGFQTGGDLRAWRRIGVHQAHAKATRPLGHGRAYFSKTDNS